MATRSSFDMRGLFSSPVLLGSFVLAVPGWFAAFIGQCVVEAKYHSVTRVSTGVPGIVNQVATIGSAAGIGWFGIFLELALIPATLWTLATNSIATYRLQLAVFLAVAIPVAVIEVNDSIYGNFAASPSASKAMGAGYLLLAMANIIWLLFLSASEDSAIFNMLGGHFAGSSGPRTGNGARRSMIIGQPFNNHRSFQSDTAMTNGHPYSPPMDYKHDSGSVHSANQSHHGTGPMMQQNTVPASTGAPPNVDQPAPVSLPNDVVAQAKALYKYNQNPDDPNEISFEKGEVLHVLDKSGKWFQVRNLNGVSGIAPSNYLQLIEA